MTKFELYTKPGCPYCVKAKALLEKYGYEYVEYTIGGSGITKESIQNRIDNLNIPTEVRTVPQIFYKKENVEKYVGGYTDLEKVIENI